MDFGLARARSREPHDAHGHAHGHARLPEPGAGGGQELDGRSDIYALGTVLYECVVGEPPFPGEAQAVVYRIVHEFPQAPRARGAAIDEALEAIILSCLQKEPGAAAAAGRRSGGGAEALPRAAPRQRPRARR